MEHKVHEGRNVKRFREMLGMKQDALAWQLGEEWTQKKISLLESKETLDEKILQQISVALNIPVEAIQNFDDEQAINIISNTFNEGSIANATAENIQCTFNPIDKLVEALEENKKLYERLLEAEKEKNELLQKLLNK